MRKTLLVSQSATAELAHYPSSRTRMEKCSTEYYDLIYNPDWRSFLQLQPDQEERSTSSALLNSLFWLVGRWRLSAKRRLSFYPEAAKRKRSELKTSENVVYGLTFHSEAWFEAEPCLEPPLRVSRAKEPALGQENWFENSTKALLFRNQEPLGSIKLYS